MPENLLTKEMEGGITKKDRVRFCANCIVNVFIFFFNLSVYTPAGKFLFCFVFKRPVVCRQSACANILFIYSMLKFKVVKLISKSKKVNILY